MNWKNPIFFVIALVGFFLVGSLSYALATDDDTKHFPASQELLVQFLQKYGFKNFELLQNERANAISFKITEANTKETVVFFIVLIPNAKIMKIECRGFADIPEAFDNYLSLLSKLDELNSLRTIGKYCTDKANGEVRFFQYITVVGGICYADFEKNLRMTQFIVFSDLQDIRKAIQ